MPLPAAVVCRELDVCFVATDSAGEKLSYVHFEDDPERRSAAKLLTRDEALPYVSIHRTIFSSARDEVACGLRHLRGTVYG